MVRRAPRRTTTPPAALPRVQRLRWAVTTALAAAGLVAVVALALLDPDRVAPGGAPGASVVRGTALAVVLVLLAAGTCSAFWRFRLEVLAWRPGPIAMLPVTVDAAADRPAPAVDARELQALVERALVRCRFAGATPVPALGRPTDFLSVVDAAGDDLSGAWGAITRFVRLLAPDTAYRVSCTVLPPRPHAAYVLVVEVSRVGRGSDTQVLVEEHTPERAAEHAAHAVAARILPRTRACANAPWTLWQDRALPVELLDAYQRFQRLRAERHMDGAMRALREAIAQDPRNLALRVELGKLQERMQMYLDALLTYDDVITVAARRDDRLATWWGAGAAGDATTGATARDDPDYAAWSDERNVRGLHRGDPVILIARYRHALLLGLGQELAQQWWTRAERCRDGTHRSAREARRAHLRRALATRLVRRHADVVADLPARELDATGLPAYLRPLASDVDTAARSSLAALGRVFFTTVGQLECEHLVDDYVLFIGRVRRSIARARPIATWRQAVPPRRLETRRRPAWARHGRRRAAVLPRHALLTTLPRACMRRAMAHSAALAQSPEEPGPAVAVAGTRVIDRHGLGDKRAFHGSVDLIGDGWPVGVRRLERVMRAITGGPTGALLTWRAHYTAAGTFALPLLPDGSGRENEISDEERARAARNAIGELERAVACADSGHLARQRDWLLSEDPDLDELRALDEFQDFEATTFGSIHTAVRRGPDIRRWEQTAHVGEFIAAMASRMAATWHRRARDETPVDDLSRWLDQETAAWELVERLAIDSRDSRTRDDVARHLGAWLQDDLAVPALPHPRFSDRRLDHQLASLRGDGRTTLLSTRHTAGSTSIVGRVNTALSLSDARLQGLAGSLRLATGACCTLGETSVFAEEETVLRAALGTPTSAPDRGAIVRLVETWCHVGEQRWAALSELFDDDTLGHAEWKERLEALTEALADRWWRDVDAR